MKNKEVEVGIQAYYYFNQLSGKDKLMVKGKNKVGWNRVFQKG